MNKLFFGLTVSVLMSLPSLAALKPGDQAPDFSARVFSADPDYCAGKFAVASADRAIANSYNLKATTLKAPIKDVRGVDVDHDLIERVTFVIGKDHKVIATFSSTDDKLTPGQHVQKALEIVQSLSSK